MSKFIEDKYIDKVGTRGRTRIISGVESVTHI